MSEYCLYREDPTGGRFYPQIPLLPIFHQVSVRLNLHHCMPLQQYERGMRAELWSKRLQNLYLIEAWIHLLSEELLRLKQPIGALTIVAGNAALTAFDCTRACSSLTNSSSALSVTLKELQKPFSLLLQIVFFGMVQK